MMKPPTNFKLRPDVVLSIFAAIAAIVWMVLIFAVGMTLPAYIAAAIFAVCAAASSLIHFHDTKDLPAEPKTSAPPLPFLRGVHAVESRCMNCDGPIRKHDKFCANCGAKVI